MLKAAAYARYSTEHQTTSSIEYQMRKINEYCDKNGIEIVVCYADEAFSGTNTNRPAFQQLRESAKLHKFDAVVIYDITRGSRDISDWFSFRKEMAQLGIQVISVEDNIGDIMNPSSFLQEFISVGLGQHHVLVSRQKSMDSIATKAQSGVFLGGVPNLGYNISADGKYVINEEEAKIVKKIFGMYAYGASYNQILSEIGDVRGKRGRTLNSNSLHYILKNERYIGIYTWCKRHVKLMGKWAGGTPNENYVRIDGAIPRIIDDETWEKVQLRMKDNKRNATARAKRDYLLSGLIECAECGGTFVGHTSRNSRGYESSCYVCGNKYKNKTCKCKNLKAAEVEACVIENLKYYLLNADFEKIASTIVTAINSASADLTSEQKELEDVKFQIANGTKAILNGLDIPELHDELLKLRTRKSELEDIIQRASSKVPVDAGRIVDYLKQTVSNLESNENLKSTIQSLIRVYAHADGSFDINIGVHMASCEGSQYSLCTLNICNI